MTFYNQLLTLSCLCSPPILVAGGRQFVVGNKIVPDSKLEKANLTFLERKTGILTEGTLKEYRTIFKSLWDFQIYKNVTLSFDEGFISHFESFSRTKTKIKKKAKNEIGALTEQELFTSLDSILYSDINSGFKPLTTFTKNHLLIL